MRTRFQLDDLEEFVFSFEGETYRYKNLRLLAERTVFPASITETILELPDGKTIWLIVVGDEGQQWENGIKRGWYVTQSLDQRSASTLVKALNELTSK